MSRFSVGDVIRIHDGRCVVITHRDSYEARAHNDRWTDYNTRGLLLGKRNLQPTKKEIRFSTDDMLNGATVIGRADVTYTVNIGRMKIGGLDG